MGIPAGVTEKEHAEAVIAQHRVPDTATFIIADAVERALRDPAWLRKEYGIDEKDWPGVLKRLQAFQRRIDPYGDWQ